MWSAVIKLVLLVIPLCCTAQDVSWPAWHGPHGNGLVTHAELADFTQAPIETWSQRLGPGQDARDYSSPVIAEGAVVAFCEGPEYRLDQAVSIDVRTWERDLRSKLKPFSIEPATKSELLAFANRQFPDVASLRKALLAAGMPAAVDVHLRWRSVVGSEVAMHYLTCWRLDDGTIIWQRQWPSGRPHYSASSTPCVRAGKIHLIDGRGVAHCFAAADGRLLWKRSIGPQRRWYFPNNHSAVVVGDKVIYQAVPLIALDADTGEPLWRCEAVADSHSTPAVWQADGRTFVLCSRYTGGPKGAKPQNTLYCVDVADGRVAWHVTGSSTEGSPCVAGGLCTFTQGRYLRKPGTDGGLVRMLNLTMAGPRVLPFMPLDPGNHTPASDGRLVWSTGVLAADKKAAVLMCWDVIANQARWTYSFGRDAPDQYSSPAVVNGHALVWVGNSRLIIVDPHGKLVAVHGMPGKRKKWCHAAHAPGYLVTRSGARIHCHRWALLKQP